MLRLDDLDDQHTEPTRPATISAYPVTRSAARQVIKSASDIPRLAIEAPPIPYQVIKSVSVPARQAVKPASEPAPVTPTKRPRREMPTKPAIMDKYRPSHINAKDAIAFAAIRMKKIYDSHYKPIFFKEGDLINLRLYRGYNVPIITLRKLS